MPSFPSRSCGLLAALLPAMALVPPAWGQAPGGAAPIQLPAVDVTARPMASPMAESRRFTPESTAAATKTDTPILETPQFVTTITREQLDARDVQSLQEALGYSAGVRTGTFGFSPRFDDFVIRGFDTVYTGLFRDGLRQAANSFTIFRTEPYGLAGINVLRGPSSALYGPSTAGGLVNLVTKRPPEESLRELQLQYGSHDRRQAQFDFGGPLDAEGRFAYRLTGLLRDADTQNESVGDDRIYIAPAFAWRPDDRTTLTLLGAWQRDRTGGTVTYYDDPVLGLTRLPSGDPAYNDLRVEHWRLGYELEHRATDALTLRQNLRFGHIDTDLEYSYILGIAPDGRSATRGAGQRRQQLNTLGVDNQAEWLFATGPLEHRLMAGFDYLYSSFRSSGGDYFDAPPLDLLTLNYGAQPFQDPAVTLRPAQRQDQFGLYLQDQIRLGQWNLTLSGRHDWVETTSKDRIAGTRETQDESAWSG